MTWIAGAIVFAAIIIAVALIATHDKQRDCDDNPYTPIPSC